MFPESSTLKRFEDWLTERNNESTEFQIKISSQLINLISGGETEDLSKVNLHQLLTVLDIPGERYKK